VAVGLILSSLLFFLVSHRDQFKAWDLGHDFQALSPSSTNGNASSTKHETPYVEIVVASTSKEDTSWLHHNLPGWKTSVYVVDDEAASLTVPLNKGRESMVYLTYIIDNYDSLPDNTIFIHASRFAWHNDDPDYDAIPALRNFQFQYLQQVGYVNLRCVWVIGCPAEIHPYHDEANAVEGEAATKDIYKQSFEELLPELPVPEIVAVSCCAQFGVTRETIQRRPKEDYVRFRQWLLDTPLEDERSGRVMEFSWHSESKHPS
jgi:hypothetical protein